MRTLFALLALSAALLVPARAEAGENKHLGVITVSGSSLTNQTTAAPFWIPTSTKLTLYCTAAVQVLTDSTSVSTGTTGTKGVPVPALQLFPTSSGSTNTVIISGKTSALIAIIGTATCDVWIRLGTE